MGSCVKTEQFWQWVWGQKGKKKGHFGFDIPHLHTKSVPYFTFNDFGGDKDFV